MKKLKAFLSVLTAGCMLLPLAACGAEHEHEFSSAWAKDEIYHWHAASCEHTDMVSEKRAHSYDGDKCTVCGYEKPHVHTFATTWSYDENNHWYAATCGHDTERSEQAAHNFRNDACRTCGYTKPAEPDPTPDPGPSGNTSKVPDSHQGTKEKDASWARYTFPVMAAAGGSELASYVKIEGVTWNVPADGNADLDGFNGVGGFRSAAGATITFTVNASAAGEVGLYGHFCFRNGEKKFSDFGTLTVNGTAVPCEVAMPNGTTEYGPSNTFTFLGYVNLKAGANTIVITRGSDSNSSFNFWGIRISTQSAKISGVAAAAKAAEVAMLPGKND